MPLILIFILSFNKLILIDLKNSTTIKYDILLDISTMKFNFVSPSQTKYNLLFFVDKLNTISFLSFSVMKVIKGYIKSFLFSSILNEKTRVKFFLINA